MHFMFYFKTCINCLNCALYMLCFSYSLCTLICEVETLLLVISFLIYSAASLLLVSLMAANNTSNNSCHVFDSELLSLSLHIIRTLKIAF